MKRTLNFLLPTLASKLCLQQTRSIRNPTGSLPPCAVVCALLVAPSTGLPISPQGKVLPSSSLLYPKEYRMAWSSFREQLHAADAGPPREKGPESPLLSSELTAAPADAYAAICIINRDQHEDLTEWVAYHQVSHHGRQKLLMVPRNCMGEGTGSGAISSDDDAWLKPLCPICWPFPKQPRGLPTQSLGFKLYVFDDGSLPPLQSVLEDYIAMGAVSTFYVRESTNPLKDKTMAMMESCLQLFGHRHKFIGTRPGFEDAAETCWIWHRCRLPKGQLLQGFKSKPLVPSALQASWTWTSSS